MEKHCHGGDRFKAAGRDAEPYSALSPPPGHCSSNINVHWRCTCRCADAFVSSGRFEAAVRLLVKGKQPERALELLLAHEVPLTEELAEALTPPKTADNNDDRNSVLLRIAQVGLPKQAVLCWASLSCAACMP
jgi:hypothetical protein